jgi:hypothetical protein
MLFQVVVRPPERLVSFTEGLRWLRFNYRQGGGGNAAVCERWVNVTPCQFSGETVSLASAVGLSALCLLWPKIRAGGVRPAMAVWRRGRQEADLQRKKRKHGRLRFFLPLGPRPWAGGCPSPFEPWKDGFATGA